MPTLNCFYSKLKYAEDGLKLFQEFVFIGRLLSRFHNPWFLVQHLCRRIRKVLVIDRFCECQKNVDSDGVVFISIFLAKILQIRDDAFYSIKTSKDKSYRVSKFTILRPCGHQNLCFTYHRHFILSKNLHFNLDKPDKLRFCGKASREPMWIIWNFFFSQNLNYVFVSVFAKRQKLHWFPIRFMNWTIDLMKNWNPFSKCLGKFKFLYLHTYAKFHFDFSKSGYSILATYLVFCLRNIKRK